MYSYKRCNSPPLPAPCLFEVGIERCLVVADSERQLMARGRSVGSEGSSGRAGPLLRVETIEILEHVSAADDRGESGSRHLSGCPFCRGLGNSSVEEELKPSESLSRFKHRFGWLVGLLMAQSLSSFILKGFERLIVERPIVILFLTMLIGAGGNAGSQSTVLAIRAITKGAFGAEQIKAFVKHEFWVG